MKTNITSRAAGPYRFTQAYRGPSAQIWQANFLSLAEVECLLAYLIINESQQPKKSLSIYTHGDPLYRAAGSAEAIHEYLQSALEFKRGSFVHLDWLYDKLLVALSGLLGVAARYHPELAPPGFIIYRQNAAIPSKPHYDLQARYLPETLTAHCDLNRIITFTMALDLPRSGSGLYYWTTTFKDFIRQLKLQTPGSQNTDFVQKAISWGFDPSREGDMKTFSFLQTQPRQFHPYKLGALNVVVGALLHCGGPTDNLSYGESRITLQGHGIYNTRGYWEIYW